MRFQGRDALVHRRRPRLGRANRRDHRPRGTVVLVDTDKGRARRDDRRHPRARGGAAHAPPPTRWMPRRSRASCGDGAGAQAHRHPRQRRRRQHESSARPAAPIDELTLPDWQRSCTSTSPGRSSSATRWVPVHKRHAAGKIVNIIRRSPGAASAPAAAPPTPPPRRHHALTRKLSHERSARHQASTPGIAPSLTLSRGCARLRHAPIEQKPSRAGARCGASPSPSTRRA